MKIIFKSAACAMVAVAQIGAPQWDYQERSPKFGYYRPPRMPVRRLPELSCHKRGHLGYVYCKYQLYGDWDLPVPQPRESASVIEPEPGCFMGRLPRRGQAGDMKRIDCWPNELNAFFLGNGPTGFTGFFTAVDENALGRVQQCYLVENGNMIPVFGSCFEAIQNTDPDRHVVEDVDAMKAEYEEAGHKFKYFKDQNNADEYYY